RDWLERIQSRLMEIREDVELDSPTDEPLQKAVGLTEDLLAEHFSNEAEQTWNRREYRYFNPSENYKGEPAEDIRKYVRQDYNRMEQLNAGDWCFIGIRADAEIGVPFKA